MLEEKVLVGVECVFPLLDLAATAVMIELSIPPDRANATSISDLGQDLQSQNQTFNPAFALIKNRMSFAEREISYQ